MLGLPSISFLLSRNVGDRRRNTFFLEDTPENLGSKVVIEVRRLQ